jgi:hypothetical protein
MFSSASRSGANLIQNPSIQITRGVLNLPDDFNAAMSKQIYGNSGMDTANVQLLLNPDSFVTLIEVNEVLNLYRAIGRPPTNASIHYLGDYLVDKLPASFDEEPTLTLQPLEEKLFQISASRPSKDARPIPAVTFRSHENLGRERCRVKGLLYDFFGIEDPIIFDREKLWNYDDAGRLIIATAFGEDNIAQTRRLLSGAEILPRQLILEGGFVEDDTLGVDES